MLHYSFQNSNTSMIIDAKSNDIIKNEYFKITYNDDPFWDVELMEKRLISYLVQEPFKPNKKLSLFAKIRSRIKLFISSC